MTTDQRRVLTKGDRVVGPPCVVTIERVTDASAYGWCASCDERHIIDRLRYEAGDGPWRPAENGGKTHA